MMDTETIREYIEAALVLIYLAFCVFSVVWLSWTDPGTVTF